MWAINFDRVFEDFARELLRRGHTLRLAYERTKVMPVGAGEALDLLAAEFPGQLTVSSLPQRHGPRELAAGQLRRTADYLRFLEPEFANADSLRARAGERVAPRTARMLHRLRPRLRKELARVLRELERALPVSRDLAKTIAEWNPDVVLVSPLITLASPQADIPPAAAAAGKPTVLVVASWDNLTNKGLARGTLQRTVVWNHEQVEEAVRLHGLPRETVTASGAHAYDHWFEWQPSSSREEFAAKVGLDPSRPYFVYACSSAFIAGDETTFVREWLGHLRATDGPLADVGVIVRPHPQNVVIWESADLEDGQVVVWPRAGETPTGLGRKKDYFDSLHHSCGVVGINTSTLVEAAIVRRPVFTVLTERYRGTQEGTLHFEHLTGDLLNTAHSWDEHLAQLEHACTTPGAYDEQIERFLFRFVRPYGLDVPAAPRAADVVEEAARTAPKPASPNVLARLGTRLLILVARLR